MALVRITSPGSEPITLAEAKAHCRIEVSDDDALITAFITAAREECEHELGRSLIAQTWEKVMDSFPDAIELLMPPIQSVTSVKYLDTIGVEQTLSSSLYALDKDSEPGWLVPASGTDWPTTGDYINAVRVRFVAGWANAAAVPENIKTWIKVRVATLYENREATTAGIAVQKVPYIDSLLDRYRIASLP